MIFYPNCKINLGLRVVERRPDGYHNLDTIFYPVLSLTDMLEVQLGASDGISFSIDGQSLDCGAENNLVVRCYHRMRQLYPIGGVDVHLTKRIPFGAGLGGGSADAAFMAIALNDLFSLHLTRQQLVDIVRPLGADCPFFIYNTPCRAMGIGDILTPIPLSLQGYTLLLVKPAVVISTREAYNGIVLPTLPYSYPANDELCAGAWRLMYNDFETSVFPLHHELRTIHRQLTALGADYVAMSGSGSTVFALFSPSSSVPASSNFATAFPNCFTHTCVL